MCASKCPPKKKKTLLDAKDGYTSVVLALGENREVTEFLCEFGRYRCAVQDKDLSTVVMHTLIGLTIYNIDNI